MTITIALLVVGGLVLLTAGGEFLVRGAVSTAERLGVSPLLAALAPHSPGGLGMAVASLVAGLLLTVLGAHWLVEGSIALARGLGIADAVIGLTIVAVGTSLPELVTSLMAARRGHPGMADGMQACAVQAGGSCGTRVLRAAARCLGYDRAPRRLCEWLSPLCQTAK